MAQGHSARSAGRLFGVSAATAVRFSAHSRDHGAACPKPQGRLAGAVGQPAQYRDFLLEVVQAEPHITATQRAAALPDPCELTLTGGS